jgi:hypothetical protein
MICSPGKHSSYVVNKRFSLLKHMWDGTEITIQTYTELSWVI